VAINLLRTLQAITRQIPDLQTVSYKARTTGTGNVDGYDANGTNFAARHGPITSGDFDGMAKRWCVWHLYATASQAVSPKRLGKITDAGGVVWHVLNVTSSFGGLKHDCECVQAVS
jgi:hypothetical protein